MYRQGVSPKHTLARNDVTLRVRHNGAKRLQTIKSGGSNGSFRRGEWEHEIKGDVPNLRKAADTPLEPLLTKKLKRYVKKHHSAKLVLKITSKQTGHAKVVTTKTVHRKR